MEEFEYLFLNEKVKISENDYDDRNTRNCAGNILVRILGSISIALWIIGVSILDSDPMVIPVSMVVIGLGLMMTAYIKGLKYET